MKTFYRISKEIDKEIRQIHKDKIKERVIANGSNSLPRIVNKYQDMVSKLEFYSPENKKETLFNLKLIDEQKVQKEFKQANKRNSGLPEDTFSIPNSKFKEFELMKSIKSENTDVSNLRAKGGQSKRFSQSVITQGNRMENTNLEFILGNNLKRYQESLYNINEKIESNYTIYTNLKTEKDSLLLQIEAIESYEKFSSVRDKQMIEEISNNKTLKKHEKDKIIQEKLILYRQNAQKEYLQREDKIKKANSQIDSITQEINKILEIIKKLEITKEELRTNIKGIKNDLLVHYHKVLYDANDVRSLGLSWIIQEIWNIGEKVQVSYMPRFLDEQTVTFLFKFSEYHLKYIRQKRKFEQYQVAIKNNFSKSIVAKRQTAVNILGKPIDISNFTKEDEGEFIIKSWLKTVKPKTSITDLETISYNNIKRFIDKKEETISFQEENFFNIQKEMELNLNELKKDMDNLVKSEVNRIFKEFIFFDYERRFNVKLEKVIRTLFGEEKANYYVNLYKLEKTKIRNNIKKVRLHSYQEQTKRDLKAKEEITDEYIFLDDDNE